MDGLLREDDLIACLRKREPRLVEPNHVPTRLGWARRATCVSPQTVTNVASAWQAVVDDTSFVARK